MFLFCVVLSAIVLVLLSCQRGEERSHNQEVTPVRHQQLDEEGTVPQNLILSLDDKLFTLDLTTIGYDGQNPETVDREKLDSWLESVKEKVDRPPVNAQLKRYGKEISPEIYGEEMDLELLKERLEEIETNQPIPIPMIEVTPDVTMEDLEKVDQKLIGSYETRFDSSNINRTINIKLSAKAIDKLILMPGEIFSFNKVVGERTVERGYKSAPIIVKGEYSEGIGGGICQLSSTLYNSVNEAGLEIISRYSHSKQVTYVPPGQDATVSWGGPDFQFKNSLSKPILLRIKIDPKGAVRVRTYTTPDAKVQRRTVLDPPIEVEQEKVNPNQPTDRLPTTENENVE